MQRPISQMQQYANNINQQIKQLDFDSAYYNRINFARVTSYERHLMAANLLNRLRVIERNFQLLIDIK